MLNTFAIAKASEKSWLKLASGMMHGYTAMGDLLTDEHPAMIRLGEAIDHAYAQSDGGCRARVGITSGK